MSHLDEIPFLSDLVFKTQLGHQLSQENTPFPSEDWVPLMGAPGSTPILTLIARKHNIHLLVCLLFSKILDDKDGLLCLNPH